MYSFRWKDHLQTRTASARRTRVPSEAGPPDESGQKERTDRGDKACACKRESRYGRSCAAEPGDGYRYEWEKEDGSGRFGFEGELLESEPPHRAVTTERMIGMDGPGSVNEFTLTPVEGGTLLTIVITYPSAEVRDMVLGTGMTGGMETSYARLESEVLAAA